MKRNLFDLDNARYLRKKELVDTFIPTSSFEEILSPKNQIIIGSRGSGKTALLKMISHDHLSLLDNPFTKEIVSRKATDLGDISESTFVSYLDELKRKYAPPKKITTKKQGAIYDQLRENPDLPMDAKLVLEIPEANKSFYDIEKYIKLAESKGIIIKFRPE